MLQLDEASTRQHVEKITALYRRTIVSRNEAVNALLLDLTPENMVELMALLPDDLTDGLKVWAANAPRTDEGWESVRVFRIGPGPGEEGRAQGRAHLRRIADALRTSYGRDV
jgi:hypothetical protein